MANPEQLKILKQGVDAWNAWRKENPTVTPDLREANLANVDLSDANLSRTFLRQVNLSGAKLHDVILSRAWLVKGNLHKAQLFRADLNNAHLAEADVAGADLSNADLSGADLYSANLSEANFSYANFSNADFTQADLRGVILSSYANLSKADFSRANLSEANFSTANLSEANFSYANLSGAHLTEASLYEANLYAANFCKADLSHASLEQATLVNTNVEGATLTGCKVHGISVWNLLGEPTEQNNLLITSTSAYPDEREPAITVDNLEVAQFIYMLIDYKKLRDVIHTVTSKVVLILGRFTDERLTVLKALQEELRQYTDENGKAKYLPVMFDFDPDKASQDFLETVQTIASMSRFIIADITSPTGVLVELASIIPNWKVPVKLLLDTSTGERPVAMLQPFTPYPWLVRSASGKVVSGYRNTQELCASIEELIDPIERMVDTVRKAKAEEELGVENLGGGNA